MVSRLTIHSFITDIKTARDQAFLSSFGNRGSKRRISSCGFRTAHLYV